MIVMMALLTFRSEYRKRGPFNLARSLATHGLISRRFSNATRLGRPLTKNLSMSLRSGTCVKYPALDLSLTELMIGLRRR